MVANVRDRISGMDVFLVSLFDTDFSDGAGGRGDSWILVSGRPHCYSFSRIQKYGMWIEGPASSFIVYTTLLVPSSIAICRCLCDTIEEYQMTQNQPVVVLREKKGGNIMIM